MRGHGAGARQPGGWSRRMVGLGMLGGLVAVGPAPATPADLRGEIRVQVTGLRSDEGELRFGLFDKKATFATKDGPIAKGARSIKKGQCAFVIPNLPYGDYAVIVGHDVNRDGKIDQNPLSAELKGISNYTGKVLWFPDFDKAKFRLDQPNVTVAIRVY